MANKHRGEAEFTAAGKRWRICIDHNAWAELEDILDLNPPQFLAILHQKQQVRHFRALLCASLRGNHPDITLKEAGDLLAEGEIVGAALGEALTAAIPEIKEAAGATGNPPKPLRGTGTSGRKIGRRKV